MARSQHDPSAVPSEIPAIGEDAPVSRLGQPRQHMGPETTGEAVSSMPQAPELSRVAVEDTNNGGKPSHSGVDSRTPQDSSSEVSTTKHTKSKDMNDSSFGPGTTSATNLGGPGSITSSTTKAPSSSDQVGTHETLAPREHVDLSEAIGGRLPRTGPGREADHNNQPEGNPLIVVDKEFTCRFPHGDCHTSPSDYWYMTSGILSACRQIVPLGRYRWLLVIDLSCVRKQVPHLDISAASLRSSIEPVRSSNSTVSSAAGLHSGTSDPGGPAAAALDSHTPGSSEKSAISGTGGLSSTRPSGFDERRSPSSSLPPLPPLSVLLEGCPETGDTEDPAGTQTRTDGKGSWLTSQYSLFDEEHCDHEGLVNVRCAVTCGWRSPHQRTGKSDGGTTGEQDTTPHGQRPRKMPVPVRQGRSLGNAARAYHGCESPFAEKHRIFCTGWRGQGSGFDPTDPPLPLSTDLVNLCTDDDCQNCSSFLHPDSGQITRGCPGATWKATGGAYGPACYASVVHRNPSPNPVTQSDKKPRDEHLPHNHGDMKGFQHEEKQRRLQATGSEMVELSSAVGMKRETTSQQGPHGGQALNLQSKDSQQQERLSSSAERNDSVGSQPEHSNAKASASEEREDAMQSTEQGGVTTSNNSARGGLPAEASHDRMSRADGGVIATVPRTGLHNVSRADSPGRSGPLATEAPGADRRSGNARMDIPSGLDSQPEVQEGVCFSYSDTVPPHLSIYSADEDCYGEWSDWSACIPFHPLLQLHHQQQLEQHKQTFRIAPRLTRPPKLDEHTIAKQAPASTVSADSVALRAALTGPPGEKDTEDTSPPLGAEAGVGAAGKSASLQTAARHVLVPLPGPRDRYDIPIYSDGSPAARCYKTRVFQVYIQRNGRGRECKETEGATHFAACSDEACAAVLSETNHLQSILDILRPPGAAQQYGLHEEEELLMAQQNSTGYENIFSLWDDDEDTGEGPATGDRVTEQGKDEVQHMRGTPSAQTVQHLLSSGVCPGRWSIWSDCGPDCYSRRFFSLTSGTFPPDGVFSQCRGVAGAMEVAQCRFMPPLCHVLPTLLRNNTAEGPAHTNSSHAAPAAVPAGMPTEIAGRDTSASQQWLRMLVLADGTMSAFDGKGSRAPLLLIPPDLRGICGVAIGEWSPCDNLCRKSFSMQPLRQDSARDSPCFSHSAFVRERALCDSSFERAAGGLQKEDNVLNDSANWECVDPSVITADLNVSVLMNSLPSPHPSTFNTGSQSAFQRRINLGDGNLFYATLLRALAKELRLPIGAVVLEQLNEEYNPGTESLTAPEKNVRVPDETAIISPKAKMERDPGVSGTDQGRGTRRAESAPLAVADSEQTPERGPQERHLADDTRTAPRPRSDDREGTEELTERQLPVRLLILTLSSKNQAVRQPPKSPQPSEQKQPAPPKRALQSLPPVRRRAADIMDDVLSLQGRVLRLPGPAGAHVYIRNVQDRTGDTETVDRSAFLDVEGSPPLTSPFFGTAPSGFFPPGDMAASAPHPAEFWDPLFISLSPLAMFVLLFVATSGTMLLLFAVCSILRARQRKKLEDELALMRQHQQLATRSTAWRGQPPRCMPPHVSGGSAMDQHLCRSRPGDVHDRPTTGGIDFTGLAPTLMGKPAFVAGNQATTAPGTTTAPSASQASAPEKGQNTLNQS
ncbi:transmembrane protein [Cystoisospora suis]|uniref:Transmembrane protein n=1 Tax=Cystoisospora suis TaxID=483139 RepID=A0A2C6L1J2_9APIC|nr:transmembrane protein [Cystoisospora suis]